jgi:hypothetical protein
MPHLPQAVSDGRVSDAAFLAGPSVSLGVLSAACMVG